MQEIFIKQVFIRFTYQKIGYIITKLKISRNEDVLFNSNTYTYNKPKGKREFERKQEISIFKNLFLQSSLENASIQYSFLFSMEQHYTLTSSTLYISSQNFLAHQSTIIDLTIEKSMEKWSQIEFKFQRRLNRDCVRRLSCYDERHRLNSTCVCTLILFITVSRRAVNRDYDDRARHRERSRSRSVSGRGGTSGRGRNFARKWLAAVLSFPPISFPRQRVRCAGRSWWKVFQRLIFER